jgi:hypothetical protein
VNKIRPFFCSGTIAYGTLRPETTLHNRVHVKSLDGLAIAPWLNSRFGEYPANACARDGAPPDSVVTEFRTPAVAARAISTTAPVARMTIADVGFNAQGPLPKPTYGGTISADDYGQLWVYSKPVRALVDAGNTVRPTTQVFLRDDRQTLYQVSSPPAVSNTGYPATSTTYRALTGVPSLRRMLNVPLLDCTGAIGNTATVLGIGRFYMMSRATDTAVFGEFAGLADARFLASSVSRIE